MARRSSLKFGPSKAVKNRLSDPSEQVIDIFRHSYAWLVRNTLLWAIATGIVGGVGGAVAGAVGAAFALIPLLMIVLTVVHWLNRQLVVSNQRVWVEGGAPLNLFWPPDVAPIGNISNYQETVASDFWSRLWALFGEVAVDVQTGSADSGIHLKSWESGVGDAITRAKSHRVEVAPRERETDDLGR